MHPNTTPLLMFTTKRARIEHIDAIMAIIDVARVIMQENGNAHQWTNGYPDKETIMNDIAGKHALVVVDDSDKIIAYYVFRNGPDPTYQTIKGGQWLDSGVDERGHCNYSVIHRIASLPNVHGIFDEIMRHCGSFHTNIRIDTHRDNHIMQHLLEKNGFVYCGIIYKDNGDERLAYQRLAEATLKAEL